MQAGSLQRQQVTYMRASSVFDDFFASHIVHFFLLEWYFGSCRSLILQCSGDFGEYLTSIHGSKGGRKPSERWIVLETSHSYKAGDLDTEF